MFSDKVLNKLAINHRMFTLTELDKAADQAQRTQWYGNSTRHQTDKYLIFHSYKPMTNHFDERQFF